MSHFSNNDFAAVAAFEHTQFKAVISRVNAPNLCSYLSGVNIQEIAEKKIALAKALGLTRLATAIQQHGNKLLEVDASYTQQAGDALVTRQPNIAIGVFSADCVPILVAEQDSNGRPLKAFAIHAGRRGVINKIVPNALGGVATRNTQVWLGPAICRECYQIDAATAAECSQSGFVAQSLVRLKNNRYLCDLKNELKMQLRQMRIANIVDCRQCSLHSLDKNTKTKLWYSHRKGDTDRMLSLIWFN